jgi:hypothetical protein
MEKIAHQIEGTIVLFPAITVHEKQLVIYHNRVFKVFNILNDNAITIKSVDWQGSGLMQTATLKDLTILSVNFGPKVTLKIDEIEWYKVISKNLLGKTVKFDVIKEIKSKVVKGVSPIEHKAKIIFPNLRYDDFDLNEIMDLGMTLRQNQLNGSDVRSGNEVLENWKTKRFENGI